MMPATQVSSHTTSHGDASWAYRQKVTGAAIGSPEIRIVFGIPGPRHQLADIDGDHRAEERPDADTDCLEHSISLIIIISCDSAQPTPALFTRERR
jgi:hypothetical protein